MEDDFEEALTHVRDLILRVNEGHNDVIACTSNRQPVLGELGRLESSLIAKDSEGVQSRFAWFERNSIGVAKMLGAIVSLMMIVNDH